MTSPAKYTLSDELSFDIILKVARPGDRVSYTDRFNVVRTGRIQIGPGLSGREHFVLNMGGAHGTPAVVDAKNFHALSPAVDRRADVAQQIEELRAQVAPASRFDAHRARPKV